MVAISMLDILLAANRRIVAGEPDVHAQLLAGVRPFVITCMDPRLVGRLIPSLGLSADPPPQVKFAGGIVRQGDVAGARSVLAAAIFNMATEVLIVGHTDCRMGKTSRTEVLNGLQRLRVPMSAFGTEDPVTFLGAFAAERTAVISSVEALRADPRMPPLMAVHGLLFHLETGRLELLDSGYAASGRAAVAAFVPSAGGRAGSSSLLGLPPSPSFGKYDTGVGFAPGPVDFSRPGPVGASSLGMAPDALPGTPPPPSFGTPPPLPQPVNVPAPPPPPPASRIHAPPAYPELKPVPPPPPVRRRDDADDEPPPPPPARKRSAAFDEARRTLKRIRRED